MQMLPYKTSQKVLKLLAAISTEAHRVQVLKRNTEAKNGYSATPCPHCEYLDRAVIDKNKGHQCKNCLWTYAVNRVTHKKFYPYVTCMTVRFVDRKYEPDFMDITTDDFKTDANNREEKEFIKKHIEWASNPSAWGTRKSPRGYRTTVNVNYTNGFKDRSKE